MSRPFGNHPPNCTCYRCNEGRFDHVAREARREESLWRTAREDAQSARVPSPAPRRRPATQGNVSGQQVFVSFAGCFIVLALVAGIYLYHTHLREQPEANTAVASAPSVPTPAARMAPRPTVRPITEQIYEGVSVRVARAQEAIKATPVPPTIQPFTADRPGQVATLTHALINEERVNNGLPTLEYDDNLERIALSHSRDMSEKGYFAHKSLNGDSFSARYAKAGYNCARRVGVVIHKGAENIHQGWQFGRTTVRGDRIISRDWLSDQRLAEIAVNGWMNSPGHRANILHPLWQREGIGVAAATDGKLLFTQNFC